MKPLWGRPALALETDDQRYLVASELHLGLESQLARGGAFLRSRSRVLADQLLEDAKSVDANRLVLLGDVKHRYTHTSAQEQRDVPAFFERLSDFFDEILITPGNHDTGLRELLPKARFPRVRIGSPKGETVGAGSFRVALFHGHTWPKATLLRCHVWLAGHTHAAARLVDETGQATTDWAWLRGRLDPQKVKDHYGRAATPALVVFPPYNPLCGGTPVNQDGLLGPVGSLADPASCDLWLLDGRRAMNLAGHRLASRRKVGAAAD